MRLFYLILVADLIRVSYIQLDDIDENNRIDVYALLYFHVIREVETKRFLNIISTRSVCFRDCLGKR